MRGREQVRGPVLVVMMAMVPIAAALPFTLNTHSAHTGRYVVLAVQRRKQRPEGQDVPRDTQLMSHDPPI